MSDADIRRRSTTGRLYYSSIVHMVRETDYQGRTSDRSKTLPKVEVTEHDSTRIGAFSRHSNESMSLNGSRHPDLAVKVKVKGSGPHTGAMNTAAGLVWFTQSSSAPCIDGDLPAMNASEGRLRSSWLN